MTSIAPSKRLKAYGKTDGKCYYCGIEFHLPPMRGQFTIDHIHPVSKGGTSDLNNLVPACRDCNNIKKNKCLDDFRCDYYRLRIGNYPNFSKEQKEWLLWQRGIDIDHEIKAASSGFKFYFEMVS